MQPTASLAVLIYNFSGMPFENQIELAWAASLVLYEKWILTYRQQHADVQITYEAVGSGEGQRRFLADAVDFGASDAALTDEQIAQVGAVRLVPATAGMVVLAYNLPQLGGSLRIPRDV
jgi:phosphate transport system substrate-binding protein